jgi:hypothetical protein
MAELKVHCARPYRARRHFVKYQGAALEKQRFHPWLSCGRAGWRSVEWTMYR